MSQLRAGAAPKLSPYAHLDHQQPARAAERYRRAGELSLMKANDQNDHFNTLERLDKEYKVSAPTVRRDAKFAEAVDKILNRVHGI